MRNDESTAHANAYLETNADLRRALGIAPSARLSADELGEGEHNRNFLFCDPETQTRYVLRVNVLPQPFHENQVRYEFDALRALERSGRTPKPLYLDEGASAPAHGALVISFCEGDELDFDHLRPKDIERVARILADVHSVPVAPDCPLYRPTDPMRALFDECVERFEAYRASAYEDARITRWAERFLSRASRALDEAPRAAAGASIVNTETLPSHFLLPHGTEAPNGNDAKGASPGKEPGFFVDWERPVIGEPAQDVAYFVSPTTTFWDSEFLFPADDVDAFVEQYWRAVDGRIPRDGFDARLSAWRMMTALRSVTWCCRALIRYAGATGAHTTDKTAQKLPVYLSDEFMERIEKDCFASGCAT